jgi:hypothetical protein
MGDGIRHASAARSSARKPGTVAQAKTRQVSSRIRQPCCGPVTSHAFWERVVGGLTGFLAQLDGQVIPSAASGRTCSPRCVPIAQQDELRAQRSPHHFASEAAAHNQCAAARLCSQGALLSPQLFRFLRAPSRLRIAATLLCLLACTVQSFVAQTHVHASRSQAPVSAGYSAAADSAAASLPASDEDSSKHTRRDGSSSCPLCQIVLHGGVALSPTFALSLHVPTTAPLAPTEQAPPSAIVAVSFSWQGRAPPLT